MRLGTSMELIFFIALLVNLVTAKPLLGAKQEECSISRKLVRDEYKFLRREILKVSESMEDLKANILETLKQMSMQLGLIPTSQYGDTGEESQLKTGDAEMSDGKNVASSRSRRSEVRTLFEVARSNSQRLGEIVSTVELIANKTVRNTSESVLKAVGSLENLPEETESLRKAFDAITSSLFVVLSDVAYSTSPRIEKHQQEIDFIINYVRKNIRNQNDSQFFADQMQTVQEWYLKEKSFTSCTDVLNTGFTENGLYNLSIPGVSDSVEMYCDQTTDGGGWIVIQRRKDGSEDFYRTWEEYKEGFGSRDGEFWIGNELLYAVTSQGRYELRVDLEDFDNEKAYAKYSNFSIESEKDNYRLTAGGYAGNAGDSLDYHNGKPFSTKDRDNDGNNCPKLGQGVWWYNNCAYSHLNGPYLQSKRTSWSSILWYYWKNKPEALRRTEMKIKKKL